MTVMLKGLRSSGHYWNVYLMIRWTIVSVVLVSLKDSYALQIIINIIFSAVFQIIIITQRPFSENKDNFFLLFNELMVSLYLYCLITLTDYNQTAETYNLLAMCLLSVVIFTLGINFFKFFVNFLGCLFKSIQKFCVDICCVFYGESETIAIKPVRNDASMASDTTMIDATNVTFDDYAFNK